MPEAAQPWRTRLYRFFFYDWMFRDADRGSRLERAAASRHNRDQAKWLPVYLLRWLVLGSVLMLLESLAERLWGDSPVSAALAVAIIVVVMYVMITSIIWAFLWAGRQTRK